MKVCFLIDAPWDKWGGGQEHVTRVANILKERYGFDVEIIHPQKINPKFNFFNFFDRVRFAFWNLWFLLTSNYDIYHSHTFSTSVFLPLVKLRGKKCAITIHGMGKELIGGGVFNYLKLSDFFMWLVMYVWPIDFRFSASRIQGFVTVGNGVNIVEFNKFKSIKVRGKFRILWVGRKYDPVKGLIYLEEAVRKISDINIELDLVDGVYGDEKIKRFKMADVFVLPSLSEGLPIVLLEAMAAKLPVIVTDVGDCGQIVKEANCGLVISPTSSDELKKAIMTIKLKPGKMGVNGYEYVKKKYSWERVGERYYQCYSLDGGEK